jgi:hypothetical protein
MIAKICPVCVVQEVCEGCGGLARYVYEGLISEPRSYCRECVSLYPGGKKLRQYDKEQCSNCE